MLDVLDAQLAGLLVEHVVHVRRALQLSVGHEHAVHLNLLPRARQRRQHGRDGASLAAITQRREALHKHGTGVLGALDAHRGGQRGIYGGPMEMKGPASRPAIRPGMFWRATKGPGTTQRTHLIQV